MPQPHPPFSRCSPPAIVLRPKCIFCAAWFSVHGVSMPWSASSWRRAISPGPGREIPQRFR
jgi:hypothetical protein